MRTETHAFQTFPEFSPLTFADKEAYDAIIRDYPPIYDMSFTGLMTMWNAMDHMAVSQLNGNLIVPYWLPGDDRHNGLSIIGKNKLDETICAVFDHLREKGEPVRLVNVPEFVLSEIQYYDMFTFRESRRLNECILAVKDFYPLHNLPEHRQHKVHKAIMKAGDGGISVRSLDLSDMKNQNLLLDANREWQKKGINDYGTQEAKTMQTCVRHAAELGIENVCIFVREKLFGFCLYEFPSDKRYVFVRHVKATHEDALKFELLSYELGKWFAEQNVAFVNIASDMGMLHIRRLMVALGPANFSRKYTIQPVLKKQKLYY